jgi:hypothetical protein
MVEGLERTTSRLCEDLVAANISFIIGAMLMNAAAHPHPWRRTKVKIVSLHKIKGVVPSEVQRAEDVGISL